MAMYKAKAKGYDGVKIIEIGEVFEFSGKPGKWMEEVKPEAKKAEEPAKHDKKKP
jgi:hypothetical protein